MSPAPHVLRAAQPMLERSRPGRPFLLMLDFDGTLSRIRRHPDHAELSQRWRALLLRLRRHPSLTLAFISGRGLADLKARLRMPGAQYVGNHGLAWSQARLGPSAGARKRWKARTEAAFRDLRSLARAYPGALLEDKGLDLSLHVRQVARRLQPDLAQDLARLCRRHGLRLRHGHKVYELRQPTGWDKGRAVRVLRGTQPAGTPCLFAGDDVTDEAGFKALRRGPCFSLRIGQPPSAARACGRRRDLFRLLTRLERALRPEA